MVDSAKGMLAARDEGWQRRVKFMTQKAALAVLGEPVGTAGHTERVLYANEVLDGTTNEYEYAVGVATNATILANITDDGGTSAVTDADLEFTVNSMFSDFSGFDG